MLLRLEKMTEYSSPSRGFILNGSNIMDYLTDENYEQLAPQIYLSGINRLDSIHEFISKLNIKGNRKYMIKEIVKTERYDEYLVKFTSTPY